MNGKSAKTGRGGTNKPKNNIIGSPIRITSYPQNIPDKYYALVEKFLNAASVDEQLGIVKTIVEEQKVSDDNNLTKFLAIVFYEAPAKHPVKCFLARHVTKSPSIHTPFTECLSSHILTQIGRNKEPYDDYEFYADVVPKLVLCLENFPSGAAALESIDAKMLIRCFFLNYFEYCRKYIRNSSSFPITKKNEIFSLEHLMLRLLVHIIQKLNLKQDYKGNEWADVLKSITCCVEELINNDEVPMDTKSLSGILFLSVETLEWKDAWKALLESTGDHPCFPILRHKAGQLAIYSAISTTVPMEKLQDRGDSGDPAVLMLLDRLLAIADGAASEPAQTLCLSRALLQLSRSLGALPPALRPSLGPRIVTSLLAFVWPHLDHHLDSVRHLTQQMLNNVIGFCADLEKGSDGVAGDPRPLDSLLTSLACVGRRGRYAAAAGAARALGAARLLRRLCSAAELLHAARDEDLRAAVCIAITALIGASTASSEEMFTTWVAPALAQPAARAAVLGALAARGDVCLLISQRVRGAALLACCGAVPQCRARLSRDTLRAAILHKNDETRLLALSLVCTSVRTTQAATRAELSLALSFLRYNINSPQPAFRHAMLDNFKKLLKRLEDSYRVLRRVPEPDSTADYVQFVCRLRQLCRGAARRGANCGRRAAALQLLAYIEVLEMPPHRWAWDEVYVDTLLQLLDDSYDTNKDLALQVLQHCPEHLLMSDVYNTSLVLRDILVSAASRRPVDSAAAAYRLRLLLSRATSRVIEGNERHAEDYNGDPSWLPHYILLKVLLSELESEAGRWGGYGLLHCIAAVIREEMRSAPWDSPVWTSLASVIVTACVDAQAQALPIVACAAPEGYLPEELHGDTCLEDGKTITSQMVLVCAWRTIKESSYIVGLAAPLRPCARGARAAGRALARALSRAAHRGALEQAAAGLEILAHRCWSSPADVRLPAAWRGALLRRAAAVRRVTRRGAGLPAAIQALVSSELAATGRADCFHECMAFLLRQATSADPVDGALNDSSRKENAPNNGIPKDGDPNDSVLNNDAPKAGAPNDSIPKDGAPNDSIPKDGAPNDSIPKDGAPNDSIPKAGAPDDSVSIAGAPNNSATNDGPIYNGDPKSDGRSHRKTVHNALIDNISSDGAASDDDFSDEESCDDAPSDNASSDNASSDNAAIGAARRALAANILRALYRHSALEGVSRGYVAAGLRVAVCGFDAASWTERTAMSLLFAALTVRAFGVSRAAGQGGVHPRNRMSGRVFFQRYPELYTLMLSKLEEAQQTPGGVAGGAVYPVLLLLARLYPSALEGAVSNLKLCRFVPLVASCSKSRVLTTRRLAAAALRGLIPPNQYFSYMEQMFGVLSDRKIERNHCHGVLLQLARLLETPPDAPTPGYTDAPGPADAPVISGAPLSANALGSADAPVRTDASVSAGARVVADAPLSADAPGSTDAPVIANAPGSPDAPIFVDAPTSTVAATSWLLTQAVGSRPCYVIAREYANVINLLVWKFPQLIPESTISAITASLKDLIFTDHIPPITTGRELCLSDCLYLYLILLHRVKNLAKITEVTLKALQHKSYEVVLSALNYILILHQEIDDADCNYQQHLHSICDRNVLEMLRSYPEYISILNKGYNKRYLECKRKCLRLLTLENDTQLAIINEPLPSNCVNHQFIIKKLIERTESAHENVSHMYLESLLKFTSNKLTDSSIELGSVLDVVTMVNARSSPENSDLSRLVVVAYLEKNVEAMMKLDLSKLQDTDRFRYKATVLATLVALLEDDDDEIRQRAADVVAKLTTPVILRDVTIEDAPSEDVLTEDDKTENFNATSEDVSTGDVKPEDFNATSENVSTGDVKPEDVRDIRNDKTEDFTSEDAKSEDIPLEDGMFGKGTLRRVIIENNGEGIIASVCCELLRDYIESLEDSAALFVLLALLDFKSEVCMTDELSEECKVFDQSERYNIFLEETIWTEACAEKLIKITQKKDESLIDYVLSILHDTKYVQTFEILCQDNFSLFVKMARGGVVKDVTVNPKIELFVQKLRGL